MGLLELLELCGCFLELVDVTALLTNLVAWALSEPNRSARREAKRAGEKPPAATGWTLAFVVLTPIAILLTILVVVKWVRSR